MIDTKGIQRIKKLRSKWVMYSVLADAVLAAGIAFLLSVLMQRFLGISFAWGMLYAAIVFGILFLLHRSWQVSDKDLAQLLDQNYPQLEESSGLLLRETGSLNLLEHLQYQKTNSALMTIDAPLSVSRKIAGPVIAATCMLAAGILLYRNPLHISKDRQVVKQVPARAFNRQEKLLPQIAHLSISIKPPAYTAKPQRQQQAFNLVAEEGSLVDWQLQTNTAATSVSFIFNDKARIVLQPANTAKTQWRIAQKIAATGFYQVSIDGTLSELYTIEIIADQSPAIHLLSPKQYTTIEYGETPQVKISTVISDDYAVKEAFIAATIASGSGEAVKFTEQKISMTGFSPGGMQYQLQQWLSLTALGMQPGDELYFYVQATDNHQQQTRSDIFIVNLPDTAQLMSLDGLANTLTLKPEYFRSQRQIIIETEQLLKDRDTLSAAAFKERSNNLGIDQKLLRLRYGKFLGDEAESGEDGAEGLGDIADFSNADKIRDAFTDKHDNAEDATFYEPETKKQLRATLTEMWGAELRLRTFVPKDALPFEYKALRLLKDLQQQSRAYVAKTNFKTTALDLKKRLTGDISKIDPPVVQKDWQQSPDELAPLRQALAVLEQVKISGNTNPLSQEIIQQAGLRLQQQAIRQPGAYLTAVSAFKRIATSAGTKEIPAANDILLLQNGLQKMLSAPAPMPAASGSRSKQALSKQYFDNLQNRQP